MGNGSRGADSKTVVAAGTVCFYGTSFFIHVFSLWPEEIMGFKIILMIDPMVHYWIPLKEKR
ncbi:MAG: hypothetical protein KAR40_01475 [Candidatus Sabulitectum sp.]|nr:hypothetical protein [Candidatus Sabulitectum sp.]